MSGGGAPVCMQPARTAAIACPVEAPSAGDTMPDYVIPMHAAGDHLEVIGGKARNLHRLCAAGVAVPRWFCISVEAFDRFVGDVRPPIEERLGEIDYDDAESLSRVSAAIARLLLGKDLPEGLLERTVDAMGRISGSGRGGRFAVRSSAVAEDEAYASFAGQFSTSLFVAADGVQEAIKRCWASAYAPGVLSYLHRRGLDRSAARLAVVVQEMVAAEVSGVMFLANPNGPPNEVVIVAGYGLGEGVVSGRVEADTYYYDTRKGDVRDEVRRKRQRVVGDETAAGGTRVEPVPLEDQLRPALDRAGVGELVEIGARIAALYDHPQDVEWAMEATGRVFVLQSRPITSASAPAGELRVFDNANIAESYPGTTTPLTFSIVREVYEKNFGNTLVKAGLPRRVVAAHQSTFKNLVGYIEGRIYYNLTNWYRMFSLVPGLDGFVSSLWDEMIIAERGRDQRPGSPRGRLGRGYRIGAIVLRLLWHFVRLDKGMAKFRETLSRCSNRFWSLDHERMDSASLCALFEEMKTELLSGCEIPILNDLYAMALCRLVQRLLAACGVDNVEQTFNELLCGDTGMESIEPVRAAIGLAGRVRRDPRLHDLFSSFVEHYRHRDGPEALEALTRLLDENGYADCAAAIHTYLRRYGFRSIGELKLEEKSFAEAPVSLVAMILGYVPMQLDVAEMEKKEQQIRNSAVARVEARLRRTPLRRAVFWKALEYCRRSVRYREASRLDRARVFGMVRRLFTCVGRDLSARGVIRSGSDIFYLSVEEILGYVSGSAVSPSLREIIEIRKADERRFRDRRPAGRIHCRGAVYLNQFSTRAPSGRGGEDTVQGETVLRGTGCSPGVVTGEACVVKDPSGVGNVRGKILVAETTEPGWVFLLVAAAGLVIERGSVLCHTAIVARELGIPTIVDVEGATSRIKDGSRVRIDGAAGEITVL